MCSIARCQWISIIWTSRFCKQVIIILLHCFSNTNLKNTFCRMKHLSNISAMQIHNYTALRENSIYKQQNVFWILLKFYDLPLHLCNIHRGLIWSYSYASPFIRTFNHLNITKSEQKCNIIYKCLLEQNKSDFYYSLNLNIHIHM